MPNFRTASLPAFCIASRPSSTSNIPPSAASLMNFLLSPPEQPSNAIAQIIDATHKKIFVFIMPPQIEISGENRSNQSAVNFEHHVLLSNASASPKEFRISGHDSDEISREKLFVDFRCFG